VRKHDAVANDDLVTYLNILAYGDMKREEKNNSDPDQ